MLINIINEVLPFFVCYWIVLTISLWVNRHTNLSPCLRVAISSVNSSCFLLSLISPIIIYGVVSSSIWWLTIPIVIFLISLSIVFSILNEKCSYNNCKSRFFVGERDQCNENKGVCLKCMKVSCRKDVKPIVF